jgi:surface polysaccharide O-acyltransferase-like enzyme
MRDFGWFIKAYIGLLILSPILNTFIENTTEKQLRWTIIYFYIFQTLYGWFPGGAQFFEYGYSTMSFIGLYLLARYLRLYKQEVLSWNKWIDLLCYFLIVLF